MFDTNSKYVILWQDAEGNAGVYSNKIYATRAEAQKAAKASVQMDVELNGGSYEKKDRSAGFEYLDVDGNTKIVYSILALGETK